MGQQIIIEGERHQRQLEQSVVAGVATYIPVPRKKNGKPRKQKVTVTYSAPGLVTALREAREYNAGYQGTAVRYQTVTKKKANNV
jgi:hypothetical protein